MTMIKRDLRKLYIEKRRHLSPQEMTKLDDLLLIRFQQRPLGDITTVLNFWPIAEKHEVNTHLIIDYLSFFIPSLQLAYPVMTMTASVFKAVLVNEFTHFQQNQLGIAEPLSADEIDPYKIDVVFVPLLAFDKKGYRVGYGKGFYDKFLKTCRTDVLKIGLSYFDAEESIDDINDFDVTLNMCITPNKIYEF